MLMTLAGVSWVVLGRTPAGGTWAMEQFRDGLMLAMAATVAQAIGFVFSKQGIGTTIRGRHVHSRAGGHGGLFRLLTVHGGGSDWPAAPQPAGHGHHHVRFVCRPVSGRGSVTDRDPRLPGGLAATLIATSPVLILPFAVLVYREKLSLQAICGAVVGGRRGIAGAVSQWPTKAVRRVPLADTEKNVPWIASPT